MKAAAILFLVIAPFVVAACSGSGGSSPTSAPDIEATVEAAVAEALPTERPSPTPDVNATITAGMAATRAAIPTPTPTAPPTPDIDATVEARLAATIAARPTAAATAVPPPEPAPTSTPAPAPAATATPAPTRTPRPAATSTPVPRAPSLSEMVRAARPAVVRIETSTGNGSGVIFETRGRTGYVITNHHVVEGFGRVSVVVNDATSYQGAVRGIDHVRDLAVVSICCGSFRSLPFGDASDLEAGDEVVAIGYALGLSGEATITRGIVSATRYDRDHQSEVIQTDAAINPGNSGGPMLSLEGEILGINTFRYDESESGRPAEGLGFAISEQTVQQRIPSLKTARAAPTPTPTRPPGPTPAPWESRSFGPVSGELRHDPSDGFIKTEYLDVSLADMIVRADFENPYSASSGSWDYGFIFRDSGVGDSARYISVVVTSRGRWEASWREGKSSENRDIGDGTLRSFDSGAGGRNTLWLAVLETRGVLFVNGEFIAMLDLPDVSGAGDIAVITGAFTGNEVAGAVTRFEDFQTFPLRKRYGPANGQLEKEPGYIAEHESGVWSRDSVVEAEFTRPPGTEWDYGFVIRNPFSQRLEVIGVAGDGSWFHDTRDILDNDYSGVAGGRIRDSGAALRERNHLLLLAFGDVGLFFLNEVLVATLDLSHNQDYGGVSAMANFYRDHTGSPSFSNFNVWTPQQ